MRIIDFHGHCGCQHNTRYRLDEMSTYLTGSLVSRMVISSLSSVFDRKMGEEDIVQLTRLKNYIPLYWLNPYLEDWEKQASVFVDKHGIKGIKIHPTANIYDPDSGMLRPVFEFCRRKKLFILAHTDTFRSQPFSYLDLVSEFTDVDVVFAHMDDPISSIFMAKAARGRNQKECPIIIKVFNTEP